MDFSLDPVEVGHSGRRLFAQATDRRHRTHRLADRFVNVTGDCTQHRSSEQHRFLRLWHGNGQGRGIRHDLADQRTPPCAAADHH